MELYPVLIRLDILSESFSRQVESSSRVENTVYMMMTTD